MHAPVPHADALCGLPLALCCAGLSVHQMSGILPDRARELYRIPDGVRPLTENLRVRNLAQRTRRPLAEFVFGGHWGTASDLAK